MDKTEVPYSRYFAATMQRMRDDGLLLVSVDAAGAPNVMTIGWATIGSIWGRPVMSVLVRPSRFTYSRLEACGDFTVNVPPASMAAAVSHCGTVSGRDEDKLETLGLTTGAGRQVRAPIIQACLLHYECRILHRNDVVPEALAQAVREDAYGGGDFHRIYHGEIVATYADEEALAQLSH